MASKLEEKLVTKMAERGARETQMQALLANIARPGARRMLVQRCMQWLEAHEQCNEAAREYADSIEQERGAA